jgi:hypothetical protein
MGPELQGDLRRAVMDVTDRNKIGITGPPSMNASNQTPNTIYEVTSGHLADGLASEGVALVLNGDEGLLGQGSVVGIAEVNTVDNQSVVAIGIKHRVVEETLGAVGVIAQAAVEKLQSDHLINLGTEGEGELRVKVQAESTDAQRDNLRGLLSSISVPGEVVFEIVDHSNDSDFNAVQLPLAA